MKSRLKFLAFIFLFLAVVYAYLVFSLSGAVPLFWMALAFPFVAVILEFSLIIASIMDREIELPFGVRGFTRKAAYFSMASLSFLLTVTLMRDAVGLIPGFFDSLHSRVADLAVLASAIVLTLIGWFTAARGLIVREIDIRSAKLSSPLRIAQISDLHIGPTIGAAYVRRVVEKTNALEADVIVLTGDIGDCEPAEYQAAIDELANLRAKHGVFYVTGNHEFYWDGLTWMDEMRKRGMYVLANSNVMLKGESVVIAGTLDPAAAMIGGNSDPAQSLRGGENASFKILLAHQPDVAPIAERLGYDLQISGHTHGGQFFPWTVVVRLVHRFHRGWFAHGRMQLYVNPGTGTWGPPVRLGATPEITLLSLKTTH